VNPSASLPQSQPSCLSDTTTGLVDCGNWAESASWRIPLDTVSGVFFALLQRTDGVTGRSHIPFVVRDDGSHSDLLFQTSDTTWHAYNRYGGNSLYFGQPAGRAYKVSYNRPITTRSTSFEDYVFNAEYPMIRFLEANGYDVSYASGVDTDRHGSAILLNHRVFMSVGHDEYWSGQQRANVEAARDAGVHLAFLSGNECFWKTRWESSIDASATAYRTLVCYKETAADAKIDPTPIWTGTWRDGRFSPPADGGRPENGMSGTLFRVNGGPGRKDSIQVPADDGKLRFWRGTSVASQPSGSTDIMPAGTLGYEWDAPIDNGFQPPGLIRLSHATYSITGDFLLDEGVTYGSGSATHSLVLYRARSGALVFGAGSVQWSWGLDDTHDNSGTQTDASMRQAMLNLFADMGVQPQTIQSGLTLATPSTDSTPPVSTILTPAAGATLNLDETVTISGTATDSATGGGQIGGVEVSVNGGSTWHPATGRETWTYEWTPRVTDSGTVTLLSRAVDDSGNLETPSSSSTRTVQVGSGGPGGDTFTIFDSTIPGHLVDQDTAAVELGVKFRSSTPGAVIGVRFYKSSFNTGTHTASLWSVTGTRLASAIFTGETDDGWQSVTFGSAVSIDVGVTYIASYHAPNGRYAADDGFFTDRSVTNGPLTALQSGTDGPNGVFTYGPAGSFPTSTFNDSNYWVDVVFTTGSLPPDVTPPQLVRTIPVAGASEVSLSASVSADFNEALDPASVSGATFTLLESGSSTAVPASVTLESGGLTMLLSPIALLTPETTYTATIKSGSNGVKDLAGNGILSDITWIFTTALNTSVIRPDPNQGPGGPILLIADSDGFSRYLAEVMRGEGLNLFQVADASVITDSAALAPYQVIILGYRPNSNSNALTPSQLQTLTSWVQAGGDLIALRPHAQLSSLLGLVASGTTLSEGYIKVDASSQSLGAGIVSETMQFHGTADLYTVASGIDVDIIATLYTSSTAPTAASNPAVTSRLVGTNGGSASAFLYDLASSIILTRQGNPAWINENRDMQDGPNRPDDLFFGAMTGDVQPDYVDRSKIAIPQADEQQRLLVNVITQRASDRMPVPRFWYLPNGRKTVIVMTADNHGGGSIAGRFEQELNASPTGCSVEDWECIRSTSYLYPASTGLTDAQARMYTGLGYEVALHVNTGCESLSREQFAATMSSQLADFAQRFPSLSSSPIVTERTHCIAWTDYTTVPEELVKQGIHLDTNYYYWPPSWVNDVPGMFTGSGFAQRFATTSGELIDVYQATTQMTDESGMSFPFTASTLMDRALGPEGYYGTFVANIHSDGSSEGINLAIIQAALARNVSVISAKQLLTWVDGRGSSSFGALNWDATDSDTIGTFTFTLTVGAGARGLEAMIPMHLIIPSADGSGSGTQIRTLQSLSGPNGPLTLTSRTVKGINYAVFSAVNGQWTATYSASTSPPPPPTQVVDTSVSDFSQGLLISGVEIRSDLQFGDGAISLQRNITRLEFDSPELPTGWAPRATPWTPGGTSSISDGSLHVDGTVVYGPIAQYSAIEFQAAFGGSTFQYVGFAADSDVNTPWFNVGMGQQTDQVYARRMSTGQSTVEVGLGADLLNTPHVYRIEWTPTEVRWYVDGALRHTDAAIAAAAAQMSLTPVMSEFNAGDGVALVVDFIQTEQYSANSTGSFNSRVFDAGQPSSWGALTLTIDSTTPTGTTLQIAVRTGDTNTPDGTWSSWVSITQGQVTSVPPARYAQYQLQLDTTDQRISPIVQSVTIEY